MLLTKYTLQSNIREVGTLSCQEWGTTQTRTTSLFGMGYGRQYIPVINDTSSENFTSPIYHLRFFHFACDTKLSVRPIRCAGLAKWYYAYDFPKKFWVKASNTDSKYRKMRHDWHSPDSHDGRFGSDDVVVIS